MWQQGPKISSRTIGEVFAAVRSRWWARTHAPLARSPGMLGNAAAGDDGRALGLGLLVVGQNLVAMLLADQRAQWWRGLPDGRARSAFGPCLQARDEGVEDRPLDIDALGAQADLAAIGEDRAHGPLDRLVEIAIGEDERRILAAELERDLAHADARPGA